MWPVPGAGVTSALEIGYAALASRIVVRTIAAGPADGPPVVLLHGWGCSAFLFRDNLTALGSAGFRAIAIDLKGHGLSDKPESEDAYTLDAMTSHVLEVLDALALSRAALVGQSMGGRIALEVARRAPGRVRRLALIAPVGIGEFRAWPLLRLGGWRALEPLAPRLVTRGIVRLVLNIVAGNRRPITADAVEGYYAPMQYAEFPRVLQQLLREFTWEPVTSELLHAIGVPILVVVGTRDMILRIAPDRPLLRERAGMRVVWVEGAGHAPNEECPDDVNRALIEFLRDPSGGCSAVELPPPTP